MRKSFRYRLYPSKSQVTRLEQTLGLCCELYNAALQERRDAYRLEHKSIRYTDQQNQLPEIKAIREDMATIHSQVLQDVLRRLDKAFQNFFRRVKERGEKAGFPRFPISLPVRLVHLCAVWIFAQRQVAVVEDWRCAHQAAPPDRG